MDNYYNEILKKVEVVLSRTLPETIEKNWISRTAGPLKGKVSADNVKNFIEPAIELLRRGGKRWRPVTMVLCCELAGGEVENILPLTPIVEFPHNGSLIIDDIEDSSKFRRGKPAVHTIFGVDFSINAGNALYFLPSLLIDESDLEEELKLRIYRYYTTNMRRLHFGQGLDIKWHNSHEEYPTAEEYIQMCRFKTGSLARLAAQTGFAVGGTDPNTCLTLGDIFEEVGVAFQIIDDVRNLTSGNPGKEFGDDIVEGKKSLPVIYHVMADPDSIEELSEHFINAKKNGKKKRQESIKSAIKILNSSGSIDRAQSRAFEMIRSAKGTLEGNFQKSLALETLIDMFDSFTSIS